MSFGLCGSAVSRTPLLNSWKLPDQIVFRQARNGGVFRFPFAVQRVARVAGTRDRRSAMCDDFRNRRVFVRKPIDRIGRAADLRHRELELGSGQ